MSIRSETTTTMVPDNGLRLDIFIDISLKNLLRSACARRLRLVFIVVIVDSLFEDLKLLGLLKYGYHAIHLYENNFVTNQIVTNW